MLVLRATKKLLRLAGPPTATVDEGSTTLLGSWYATVLFWRPRVALLVNESTLLPVFMPLAPARTLPVRVAAEIASVLAAHHAPETAIDEETRQMQDCRFGTTTNRSVVGVMTDFARLAEFHRENDPNPNLLDLSLRLATTPCSPLYSRKISPDRELAATLRAVAT